MLLCFAKTLQLCITSKNRSVEHGLPHKFIGTMNSLHTNRIFGQYTVATLGYNNKFLMIHHTTTQTESRLLPFHCLNLKKSSMSAFDCPLCSKIFVMKAAWVYHLEHQHGLAPVSMYPTTLDPSQATLSGPDVSTPSLPLVQDMSSAIGRFKVGLKVSFKVAYDRGDEAQPVQVTIQKDESFNMFFRRLHGVFYGDSFERSLRRWEYILVSRRYKKGDPLPLTSSNTYYAMLSELLRPRSRWRHAIIRRSVGLVQ